MRAIAYVSSAAWDLLDEEVDQIVQRSRRSNQLSGISGVLLYCDGSFMQYIEGEPDAVESTFARIKRSEQHYQINELMNQDIDEREFGGWTLGFTRTSPSDFLEVSTARWKGPHQTGPGAQLLRTFWCNCRYQFG